MSAETIILRYETSPRVTDPRGYFLFVRLIGI